MSESDVDLKPAEIVEVTIFNQVYRLRSAASPRHVEQVARLVDERMRSLASQLGNHDIFKIAVLAALNIADEMQSLRDYYEKEIEPLLAHLPAAPKEAEAQSAEAASAATAVDKPQSWFDDFFEAKVETKSRADRLSSQVSAKLKSLRHSNADQLGITPEDETKNSLDSSGE